MLLDVTLCYNWRTAGAQVVEAVDRHQLCGPIGRDGEQADEGLDASNVAHQLLVLSCKE